jgi:glycosyltransferase involved in cell wall biosynthesis
VRLIWRGPAGDPSGYAEGARAWLRGLTGAGARVRLEPQVWHYREVVTPAEREWLLDLAQTPLEAVDASVQNTFARLLDPYAPGRVRIARTMFETDRIPPDWVTRCNQMDEVWVPTEHNRRAFAASGVDPDRLWVVPEPFELERFLTPAEPLEIPEAHGTVVLASLDWTLRKGWDLLLSAWCEAFRPEDDVTLVIKAWSTSRGLGAEEIRAEAVAHLRRSGRDPARIPDVVLLDRLLSSRDVPSLYAACDVVCAPTRGEGWGRPLTEAMAAGRPVIATAWSGPAEFVDETVGWPLGCRVVPVPEAAAREVPAYAGHRWAEPDLEDLVRALREVHERPDEVRARGAAARERARRFDHRRVARLALERLARVAPRRRGRRRSAALPGVVLEGAILREHSLAGVNRELARALLRAGGVELSLVDTEGAALDARGDPGLAPLVDALAELLPAPPQVTVRHRYPPVFTRPAAGRLVCVLPWEFGPPPLDWLRALEAGVDEVWVPSTWVREGYVAGGMDPQRVAVVPNGVDPRRFRPGIDPLDLGDAAPGFRFLFVGGLLWRKGPDILLDAYLRAFTRADDVTLVVKDFAATGPYRPQEALERLREVARDPGAPRVAHFTGVLPEADVPRLYAACDCLVHPYRGEGYGLPIAEAMACGLPVVVPDRGACRDFAGPDTALLVPSREIELATPEVGGLLLAGRPRMVEVDPDDLAAAMRRVYEDPQAAAAVGRRASEHVRGEHTWDRAAAAALARLLPLAGHRRTAA